MRSLKRINPVHFILPALALRRYVSTYYFFDFTSENGEMEDLLHPEWASAHYTITGSSRGSIIGDPPLPNPDINITGPTGKAARIFFEQLKMVGIGLLPLGWYRLVGCPADRWANKVGAIEGVPEFRLFENIWREMRGIEDPQLLAQLFDQKLAQAIRVADPLEIEIENIHEALANPDISSVADLSDLTGIGQQRLERLSRRIFGFPPKRLLRRQRFLRTLGSVMMDPELKWSVALDDQYFDQAHFNRDFQEFMGMTPGQYLAMPRPISIAATLARAEQVGHPLQALQGPGLSDKH
jgi:methylphosphotriester-DNA--protein-cysteine methyltransferase